MVTLIAVETFALIILALLVAGLLRSHAEILRRLSVLDRNDRSEATRDELPDWVPRPRAEATPAFDIAGTSLRGDPVQVGVVGARTNTLIAFLSSGCATCLRFWEGLREQDPDAMPDRARVVVVTKDSSHESPARLRELAPKGVPVVMSTAAWEAYRVPLSPYFIYVDGRSGEVVGEGAASTWEQVLSLLTDAIADAAPFQPGDPANGHRRGASTRERLSRADAELAAAGIGPGHPSLYARDREDEEGR